MVISPTCALQRQPQLWHRLRPQWRPHRGLPPSGGSRDRGGQRRRSARREWQFRAVQNYTWPTSARTARRGPMVHDRCSTTSLRSGRSPALGRPTTRMPNGPPSPADPGHGRAGRQRRRLLSRVYRKGAATRSPIAGDPLTCRPAARVGGHRRRGLVRAGPCRPGTAHLVADVLGRLASPWAGTLTTASINGKRVLAELLPTAIGWVKFPVYTFSADQPYYSVQRARRCLVRSRLATRSSPRTSVPA